MVVLVTAPTVSAPGAVGGCVSGVPVDGSTPQTSAPLR